ncbi:uncharacterized protein HMPREF1541_07916 [Cyphellophora europaea CBS 101466]|uniref:Uncharacterized protein n=1 Tax=Cyphellophora europaea (strain CBS 101466) TaxID=1220924 RepID=W2RMI6_CYPE1|nr:uncharacterized protein HMPREF1541_07916 [Cyphellophora europaea CBS 101466]ETN36929.1 hypothetical protein HMPREF1541_07916 [Cyphellophora europaea CBS 101466]
MADPSNQQAHLTGLVQAAAQVAQDDRQRANRLDNIQVDAPMAEGGFSPQTSPGSPAPVRTPGQKPKKKSARPTNAEMMRDLELAPEHFLALQDEGKAFMFDPTHPERRNIIGDRRAGGESAAARERLWGCIETFLTGGAGDKYFSRAAARGPPGSPVRTRFWPEDAHKIMQHMRPFMRRFVNNEKQRLYVHESRSERVQRTEQQGQSPEQQRQTVEQLGQLPPFSSIITAPPIDPAITSTGYIPSLTATTGDTTATVGLEDLGELPPPVQIMINIMRHDSAGFLTRVIPRFTVDPNACTTLAALHDCIKRKFEEPETAEKQPDLANVRLEKCEFKVLLPEGLVPVNGDTDWMVALLSCENTEWMDSQVRVLVMV